MALSFPTHLIRIESRYYYKIKVPADCPICLNAQGQERVASEARSLAAWATLELSDGKLAELARRVRRDPSTLTCAVRRLEKRQERDPILNERMERLRRELQEVQTFKA